MSEQVENEGQCKHMAIGHDDVETVPTPEQIEAMIEAAERAIVPMIYPIAGRKGMARAVARAAITAALSVPGVGEYTDTDEELAMANARLEEAETLLRRWMDRWPYESSSALFKDTEAWL